MGFKAACLFHGVLTVLYYKYTESLGMYFNWGYLTQEQQNIYILGMVGWFVIICLWIGIFQLKIDDLEEEQ